MMTWCDAFTNLELVYSRQKSFLDIITQKKSYSNELMAHCRLSTFKVIRKKSPFNPREHRICFSPINPILVELSTRFFVLETQNKSFIIPSESCLKVFFCLKKNNFKCRSLFLPADLCRTIFSSFWMFINGLNCTEFISKSSRNP